MYGICALESCRARHLNLFGQASAKPCAYPAWVSRTPTISVPATVIRS